MFILSILFHIVSYDLWFYLSHIMLHKIRHPNIKDIHSIHHAVPYEQLKWYNASDRHIIEKIIQPLGILFPCIFFIDITPITERTTPAPKLAVAEKHISIVLNKRD